MRIKELLPNILMGVVLVSMFMIPMAGPVAYGLDTTNLFGPRGPGTEEKHDSPVSGTTFQELPYSGETPTRNLPDGTKIFTTYGPPKANGEIPPSFEKTTYPSGIQDIKIYNQNGDVVSFERKNKDGSTETFHYDGKGHLTSITNKDPNGLRVIKTCDSANCQNILEKGSSLSSKQGKVQKFGAETGDQSAGRNPLGAGASKQKLQTQVLRQTKDELKVQDLITGGKQKLNVGTSGLTGGQTSQVGGSGTQKLQTEILRQTNQTAVSGGTGKPKLQNEVLHHINDKPQVQDWSSVAGRSAGAGPIQHKRNK